MKADIVGIGNAIVDILCFTEEEKLNRLGLPKGGMTLIDELRAESIYQQMGPATECSGGSAANTLAGIASLGGKTGFIGKVRDDAMGKIFRHDMNALGVDFPTPAATSGKATARCHVFVTEDAQRTMATYLGICPELSEEDMDARLIADARILYIEGYLWDRPETKQSLRKAMRIAKDAGVAVALTLSDTFCVERHLEEFRELVGTQVDILFANIHEAETLTGAQGWAACAEKLKDSCDIVAITRGEEGSVVLHEGERCLIPAEKLEKPVDTTGAGDLYASGFLYGLTQGMEIQEAAKLASRCASEIISQMGARPLKPLHNLLAA